jgi:hypothetical protein
MNKKPSDLINESNLILDSIEYSSPGVYTLDTHVSLPLGINFPLAGINATISGHSVSGQLINPSSVQVTSALEDRQLKIEKLEKELLAAKADRELALEIADQVISYAEKEVKYSKVNNFLKTRRLAIDLMREDEVENQKPQVPPEASDDDDDQDDFFNPF